MSTLTAFLLARIAEDEVRARLVQSEIVHVESAEAAEDAARELMDPGRVLADCKAKRAMVEWFGPAVEEGNGYGAAADHAMQHLAQSYADHSDYREEWRP